jgi:hypothetical protein
MVRENEASPESRAKILSKKMKMSAVHNLIIRFLFGQNFDKIVIGKKNRKE